MQRNARGKGFAAEQIAEQLVAHERLAGECGPELDPELVTEELRAVGNGVPARNDQRGFDGLVSERDSRCLVRPYEMQAGRVEQQFGAFVTGGELDVQRHFAPDAMRKAKVDPPIWDDGGVESLPYLESSFGRLNEFYRQAAAAGDYVAVIID